MKTSKPTTNETATNLGTPMADIPARPTVNAAAALGLPESPHDTIANAVTKMRKDHKLNPLSPFNSSSSKNEDESEEVVEKSLAKAKPVAKTAEKKVSSKPKLISEKPIVDGEVQDEETDSEGTDSSEDKGEEAEKKAAPAAVAKPEETDAFKKLAKEHEDTKKRLDEVLAKINTVPAAPKAETAKAESPKPLSPEEVKKEEQAWIQDATQYLDADLSEADHNAILDGGPAAVAKVVEMRKKDMAQSILKARQLINSDFNPVAEKLMNEIRRMAPVYDDYIKTQAVRVEQAFTGKYPEIKPYIKLVRQVSNAMFQKYPEQMSNMSEEETFQHVYDQTVNYLRDTAGIELQKAATTAAAPVTPAPVVTPPVTPAPVAQTPPAPVASATPPMPKPPGSTAPGAIPQATPDSKDKSKAIAQSLTY